VVNKFSEKADEPQSDEWLLVAQPALALDKEHEPQWLLEHSTAGAFCSNCGRLWAAWGPGVELSEYVPADPTVRPVRRNRRVPDNL
jgi:hypothetical protein